ncbi:MAG: anhydro-N-acetylmuramic acid kinase [Alphaproteobacteria bacterium]|mgnify:CR=1 FL=1|nr:anhydro-N-acetylmuramic acid kinase [Alphaproteobacteria bacterium]
MARVLKAIGLMSGTSMDGIDAAILDTDGERIAAFGPARFEPYSADMRARLREAIDRAATMPLSGPLPADIEALERELTQAHARAVTALLMEAGLTPNDIDVVGFHGQTLVHRPQHRMTLQIGSGPRLAQATGIDVVNDFRTADVRAGGQGAPLVPIYHAALAADRAPVAVLNIGGVANVTFVGRGGELIAFDTGPGNAPIDDWALKHTGQPIDKDGALAAKGRVNENVVAHLLEHAYFAKPAPKSLDRMDFALDMARNLTPEDGAATLTAFTARAIAKARAHLPRPPQAWIVCGGGRLNPTLMRELRTALDGATVLTAEDAGWRGDFIEAEATAYLAVRSLRGLPISFPLTTGVPRPMAGGALHNGRR